VKKRTSLCLAALLVAGSLASHAGAASPDLPQKKSLYQRLGGYDALAAVTDDFITRLATDKELSKFFVGLNNESKKRVREHVIDLLCAATGGPCIYLGQDVKTAHKGLGITQEDWDISVRHLVESLDKFKVGKREKDELLTALSTLKNDIVEK
jgi:hemoglobin